jgi:hypothetical protein
MGRNPTFPRLGLDAFSGRAILRASCKIVCREPEMRWLAMLIYNRAKTRNRKAG